MSHVPQIRPAASAREPLFVIFDADDKSAFAGTRAECLSACPGFDPDSNEVGPVRLGELRDHLGVLVDPTSADAQRLYRAFTGAPDASADTIYAWLVNGASHMPHLCSALALIARQQCAISDDNLSQLLRESRL